MSAKLPTIAILGGTGPEGTGLGLRWAKAGYPIVVGSRTLEKAQRVAAALNASLGEQAVVGMENPAAARACDLAVLTVPYAGHRPTLESVRDALQGKILVDVTVPLVPPRVSRVHVPAGGSAGQEAQALLGDNVRVVTAFQNISARHLDDPEHPIECDVLVCGNDNEAREQVIALAEAAGLVGWHAGPLDNSMVVEGLTSVLIGLNIRHKVKASGIRITGIPRET